MDCPYLRRKSIFSKKLYCTAVFPESRVPSTKDLKKILKGESKEWSSEVVAGDASKVDLDFDLVVCEAMSGWKNCPNYLSKAEPTKKSRKKA